MNAKEKAPFCKWVSVLNPFTVVNNSNETKKGGGYFSQEGRGTDKTIQNDSEVQRKKINSHKKAEEIT